MYYIKFAQTSVFDGVWVRNKRKNENIDKYHAYLSKKILNNMATTVAKIEEYDEENYSFFERRRILKEIKEQYRVEAQEYADITIKERYPEFFATNRVEDEMKENFETYQENEVASAEPHTMDELVNLVQENNPNIHFCYENKNDNKIYMDAKDLSKINLPEGYSYQDENSIVDNQGNVIQVLDVRTVDEKPIKKKWSFKNLFKKFSKKRRKKEKTEQSSIYDEMVENYSDDKKVTPQKNQVIYDELVENFGLEKPSIYDEIVENFDKKEQNKLPKYQEKEIRDEDILSMNIYSNSAKNDVLKKKANHIFSEVLEDKDYVLTKDKAIMLNKEFNFGIKAFDVNLDSVNYPPRQLDCGCGIVEIYGDEFSMLVESKYESLKENEEEFKKLPKAQRENFDAYYKRELKNAFDYSNKGKVKLMKTEYEKLLKIHNDYFKLCTIRREKEHLLEMKNAYIEKQIKKLVQNINADFEQGEENLSKAEAKYMASLEKVQPVKVIKK